MTMSLRQAGQLLNEDVEHLQVIRYELADTGPKIAAEQVAEDSVRRFGRCIGCEVEVAAGRPVTVPRPADISRDAEIKRLRDSVEAMMAALASCDRPQAIAIGNAALFPVELPRWVR